MKYQSELIKDILEERGHEKSSLHYESECIETWIEENKVVILNYATIKENG